MIRYSVLFIIHSAFDKRDLLAVGFTFSLLIMYGSSYMFRHYIAIIRERS
jgi:hypothetical protein